MNDENPYAASSVKREAATEPREGSHAPSLMGVQTEGL